LRCELISVAKQELVARNELVTPGYNLFNISFSTKILTAYFPLGIDLQWQNVFNAKYFSHLSFYRQLQLPEAGTNIQLSLSVPINANVK
jgi:iron complex outermembrane receptor protein